MISEAFEHKLRLFSRYISVRRRGIKCGQDRRYTEGKVQDNDI